MMNVKKHEQKLDKELKDTFPASDPSSGNIFVGAPENDDEPKAEDEADQERSSRETQKTSNSSPDNAE